MLFISREGDDCDAAYKNTDMQDFRNLVDYMSVYTGEGLDMRVAPRARKIKAVQIKCSVAESSITFTTVLYPQDHPTPDPRPRSDHQNASIHLGQLQARRDSRFPSESPGHRGLWKQGTPQQEERTTETARLLTALTGRDISALLEEAAPYASFRLTCARGDQKDLLPEHIEALCDWITNGIFPFSRNVLEVTGVNTKYTSESARGVITKGNFSQYWQRFKENHGLDEKFPSPYGM